MFIRKEIKLLIKLFYKNLNTLRYDIDTYITRGYIIINNKKLHYSYINDEFNSINIEYYCTKMELGFFEKIYTSRHIRQMIKNLIKQKKIDRNKSLDVIKQKKIDENKLLTEKMFDDLGLTNYKNLKKWKNV